MLDRTQRETRQDNTLNKTITTIKKKKILIQFLLVVVHVHCPKPKHKMHKCTTQYKPESFLPPQLNVEATWFTKSWLYKFEGNLIFL